MKHNALADGEIPQNKKKHRNESDDKTLAWNNIPDGKSAKWRSSQLMHAPDTFLRPTYAGDGWTINISGEIRIYGLLPH